MLVLFLLALSFIILAPQAFDVDKEDKDSGSAAKKIYTNLVRVLPGNVFAFNASQIPKYS